MGSANMSEDIRGSQSLLPQSLHLRRKQEASKERGWGMGWIEQWGMRAVSGASNQDPSEYCAEVRRGRKGQRNWRTEGPNVAIQTSVTPSWQHFKRCQVGKRQDGNFISPSSFYIAINSFPVSMVSKKQSNLDGPLKVTRQTMTRRRPGILPFPLTPLPL